jgi:hypothetical protein
VSQGACVRHPTKKNPVWVSARVCYAQKPVLEASTCHERQFLGVSEEPILGLSPLFESPGLLELLDCPWQECRRKGQNGFMRQAHLSDPSPSTLNGWLSLVLISPLLCPTVDNQAYVSEIVGSFEKAIICHDCNAILAHPHHRHYRSFSPAVADIGQDGGQSPGAVRQLRVVLTRLVR